jgi:hypothetical protein
MCQSVSSLLRDVFFFSPPRCLLDLPPRSKDRDAKADSHKPEDAAAVLERTVLLLHTQLPVSLTQTQSSKRIDVRLMFD